MSSHPSRIVLLSWSLLLLVLALGPVAQGIGGEGVQSTGWPACDPGILQLSGYVDIPGRLGGTKHMFYWLFGPRQPFSAETETPVILWLSGGPGCSSSFAILKENGPCALVEGESNLRQNEYSWNTEAYLLYIDQPVGTGYSYSDDTEDVVGDEDQVAADMYEVLRRLGDELGVPSITGNRNPLYIFGESYAGHYIPAIATRLLQENLRQPPSQRLNLHGLAIGNGWTDPLTQAKFYPYAAYYQCRQLLGYPCVSSSDYQKMAALEPKCSAAIERCVRTEGHNECKEAMKRCGDMTDIFTNSGINMYDIRKACVGDLCYPMDNLTRFLNEAHVKAALGVDRPWEMCSGPVHERFTVDYYQNFSRNVAEALESGVRVMLYAGDMDFICNSMGIEQWVSALEWPGATAFRAAPVEEFKVNNRWAGSERYAGGLSFVKVYGAGHMVPMDSPAAALHLVKQFIRNKPVSDNADV